MKIPKVGLVACSKTKLAVRAPAQHLYTSMLFTKSFRVAQVACTRVYIMSAKFGLVHPDVELAPYDFSIDQHTKESRREWAGIVARTLFMVTDAFLKSDFDVEIYAGRAYVDPVRELLVQHRGRTNVARIYEPLAGMMIGERLAYLKGRGA